MNYTYKFTTNWTKNSTYSTKTAIEFKGWVTLNNSTSTYQPISYNSTTWESLTSNETAPRNWITINLAC